MKSRYIYNTAKVTGDRIKSKDILSPKIRAEFYVRLFSLLKFEPEITYEGYEFYIKDNKTNLEFSAGLTGFGPGYFCKEKSIELESIINEFDKCVFDENLNLIDCLIEFEHDYGKSIFGFKHGEIFESDIEEE